MSSSARDPAGIMDLLATLEVARKQNIQDTDPPPNDSSRHGKQIAQGQTLGENSGTNASGSAKKQDS